MAKRKYSYEFIKSYIKSDGYEILTTEEEYVNVKTPLKLKCSFGHVYTTSWGHFFHRKHRCKLCNKHTIDYVKNGFSGEGYTLLEKEYINSTTKMMYMCSRGHKHLTTWNTWRNGSRCPECVKVSYRKVVNEFKKCGYKILSKETEYTFAKFKFKFLCPNGHVSSMNWYNFKRGNRCGECAFNKKKTIEDIIPCFEDKDCTLLSKDYINSKESITYKCPNGHEHTSTWSNFNKGQGCSKCDSSISKVSQKWLDSLGVPEQLREYRLRGLGGPVGFLVDAFDPNTNTAYEFLGDFWHGNPEIYSAEEINPINKKSFGELYEKWTNRKHTLEKAGYKVVYIWESVFLL